jgi:hypothetical protein
MITPPEDPIQKLAAGKLFRTVAQVQSGIHLCTYISAFVKLIMIEAGGYYNTSVIAFMGITLGSMPLFAIALWLIQHSLKISKRKRFWGYFIQIITLCWSISIIKFTYWM